GRLRREDDLLLSQLVVDVRVGEAVTPHEEATGDHKDDDHHQAAGACQNIEYFALHDCSLRREDLCGPTMRPGERDHVGTKVARAGDLRPYGRVPAGRTLG